MAKATARVEATPAAAALIQHLREKHGEGVRFITRSRLFTDEELECLPPIETVQ